MTMRYIRLLVCRYHTHLTTQRYGILGHCERIQNLIVDNGIKYLVVILASERRLKVVLQQVVP